MNHINQVLQALGKHVDYEAKLVSWEDGKRNQNSQGQMSVWGSNVSDVTLYEQSDRECVVIGPIQTNRGAWL